MNRRQIGFLTMLLSTMASSAVFAADDKPKPKEAPKLEKRIGVMA